MHFSNIVITTALIAASSTMAYDPCPAHTYPKCCGVDVLDLADFDCNTPKVSPTSFDLFTSTCGQQGKAPKCCAIPVGGQALFCVPAAAPPNPSPPAPNNQRPLGNSPATSPTSKDPSGNGNSGSGSAPDNGSSSICSSLLYSNAQCCSTDVLGVADLDCAPPDAAAKSGKDFESICAQTGKQAACCTVPILGQGVLCTKPVGA